MRIKRDVAQHDQLFIAAHFFKLAREVDRGVEVERVNVSVRYKLDDQLDVLRGQRVNGLLEANTAQVLA